MDLLKDITRELRGGDDESGSADGGRSGSTPTTRGDSDRRDASDGGTDRTPTPNESPTDGRSADGSDESSAGRATSPGRGDEPADRPAEDVHVCSFCETEFDASDSVCPECDAEIVIRGDR